MKNKRYSKKDVDELIYQTHSLLSTLHAAEQYFNESGEEYEDIKRVIKAMNKLARK